MRCGTRVAATAGSPFTRLFICSIFHLREVGPVARGESSNIICDMGFQTHDTHCKPDAVMAVKAPLAGKPGRRRRTGSPSPADLPPEC